MNRREYIKNTIATLGLSITGFSIIEMMASCKNEANINWKPVFLDNNHAALLSEITEIILPKTKTPGAKEIGVPQFIDKMIKETMDENAQKEILAGFDDFETNVKTKYGKSFLEISEKEKLDYLTKLDIEKPKSGLSMWGITLEKNAPKPSFFKIIKGLTLVGFYSSEKIGKEVLVYDPVPGEYIGCMPLKNQNSWTE